MFVVTMSGELANLNQVTNIYLQDSIDDNWFVYAKMGYQIDNRIILFSGDYESCKRYLSKLFGSMEIRGLFLLFKDCNE